MSRTPYVDTEVPVEKSQQNIRMLLEENGARAMRFTYYQTSAMEPAPGLPRTTLGGF